MRVELEVFPGNALFEAAEKHLELLGKPKRESGIQGVSALFRSLQRLEDVHSDQESAVT